MQSVHLSGFGFAITVPPFHFKLRLIIDGGLIGGTQGADRLADLPAVIPA
jgi:hypothetical protein